MSSFSNIILTDVFYGPNAVQAAGICIQSWDTPTIKSYHVRHSLESKAYIPGSFYQRELPPLLDLLSSFDTFDCIVVDAHVWLQEDKPGCGHYLWEHLQRKKPVIGVAKRPFHNGIAEPLLRGESKNPLYITSVGIDVHRAKAYIKQMHGSYRIPTLLKAVDHLSRHGRLP